MTSCLIPLDREVDKVDTNAAGVAVLPWDDVKLGGVLGEGSFNSVHSAATSNRGRELLLGTGTTETRATIKNYALKRLHERVICDEELRLAAAKDLVFEVTILSSLPAHENIIRIRAISDDFWDNPEKGFMLMDLLHETLDRRLSRWRAQENRATVPFFGRQRQRCRDQQERVSYAALGIAKGVEFLHRNRVIYRDLKPKNVGFDQDGCVQIFDFGLARIIPKGSDGLRLTGSTGTTRYMAPEVARCDDYAFSADIYSFAILLWEICTLQTAFVDITGASVFSQIVHGGVRPAIRKIGTKSLRELLQASWHPNPDARPSFATIVAQLQLEVKAVSA
jgi:serine/threonine protein kinase